MLLRAWILAWLIAVASAQSVPNPAFQETAVIPSFHRRNPEIVYFRTFHKQPVDERHLLLVVRGGAPTPGWDAQPEALFWSESDLLGVFLMDTSDEGLVWDIAMIPGLKGEVVARVEKADRESIVVSMTGNYGTPMPWLKVFFNVASKREIGQRWFTPPSVAAIVVTEGSAFFVAESGPMPLAFRLSEDHAQFVNGEELERALARTGMKESRFGRLASAEFAVTTPTVISPFGPGDGCRCENCPIDKFAVWSLSCTRRLAGSVVDTLVEAGDAKKKRYRIPQTSFEEFAAARPERVKHGYGRDAASLLDQIGPYQLDGNRLWFAKLFYDGEGLTGLGGLGYFDLVAKQFTMFAPPEIVDWSASAIFVEQEAIWVALVGHPEGAIYSGGLLRFDRATERAKVFPVPDTIFELKASESGILAGTSNGLYIVRPGRTVRISIEPDAKGDWQAVTTVMPGPSRQP